MGKLPVHVIDVVTDWLSSDFLFPRLPILAIFHIANVFLVGLRLLQTQKFIRPTFLTALINKTEWPSKKSIVISFSNPVVGGMPVRDRF